MKQIRIVLLLSFLFLSLGCAHSVHLVHVSDFSPYPKGKGQLITVETEQFAVMGFVTDTKYVDRAYFELQKRCKGGLINGITTEYMTNLGFFSWTNKIIMRGFCHS